MSMQKYPYVPACANRQALSLLTVYRLHRSHAAYQSAHLRAGPRRSGLLCLAWQRLAPAWRPPLRQARAGPSPPLEPLQLGGANSENDGIQSDQPHTVEV
jgi:hypothetical protein